MTKAELIAKIAENTGKTKKDSDEAVSAVFDLIAESLSKGEKVQIAGFGVFEAKDRPARTCINPATKQKIQVAATRVPAFKAGKALKEAVAK